jgi:hypothetical protein
MEKTDLDIELSTIIARLDQSTLESLLSSVATELLRIHNALSNARARITALEVIATLNDKIIAADNPQAFDNLPRSIIIEASFALSAETGFYWLEYDTTGRPYRWTGPESLFFFELFVDRNYPLDMSLRYSRLQVPGINPVRCYVDGKEVEVKIRDVDGEFEVYAVIPPRRFLGGTVIMFECWNVQVEKEQSADSRKLGLAFRWLKIDGESHCSAIDRQASLEEVKWNGRSTVTDASLLQSDNFLKKVSINSLADLSERG